MTKTYYFKSEKEAGDFVEYASHYGIYSWRGAVVEMADISEAIEKKLDRMAEFPSLAKALKR